MLTATAAEKVVVFSYTMTGSSSVSLQVERKTEFAGWSTLFAETLARLGQVPLSEGTVGLRLLAGAGVLAPWSKWSRFWLWNERIGQTLVAPSRLTSVGGPLVLTTDHIQLGRQKGTFRGITGTFTRKLRNMAGLCRTLLAWPGLKPRN